MRILVNAISARLGGGQTYIRNLLSAKHIAGVEKIYVLKPGDFLLDDSSLIEVLPVPEKAVTSPLYRAIWEKLNMGRFLRDYSIDIYFCPGGSLNFIPANNKRIKSVVTFQNMLPLDDAQVIKYGISKMRFRNVLLKRIFRKSMKAADLVIFLSSYARDCAMQLCKRGIKSSVLVPHGIEACAPIAQGGAPQNPAGYKYLLYVSTIDVYKSQMEVVQAFSRLRNSVCRDYKLVFAGSAYPPYKRKLESLITKLGLEDEVILTGMVGKDKLSEMYANAEINIFASQTENCPFILLEAMASGRPVLSSNFRPMPELAGDAVLYFDPTKPDELVGAVEKLLGSPELMKDYGNRAREKVSKFVLDDAVRDTWTAIVSD